MRNLIVCLFTVVSWNNYAQRITSFNLFPINNGVQIQFAMAGGTSCDSYSILHSVDSINFISIYDDFNGCIGSSTNESYTHTNPALNQNNYYKIQLQPYEVTPIKGIYVTEHGRGRMLAYPNPVFEQLNLLGLRIFNAGNTRFIGFLYSQSGMPLREFDITTARDLASIDIGGLRNGMYVIWLTEGSQVYSAKLIINR
jgi:hypothetical protein